MGHYHGFGHGNRRQVSRPGTEFRHAGAAEIDVNDVDAVWMAAQEALERAPVCTENTIPYNRDLDDETLPSTRRIVESAMKLVGGGLKS